MLEVAEQPLAQRLWRVCKLFKLPLNDSRIQEMDMFELEFYEYSQIVEDPEKLERFKNRYFDPDFDEWLEEFEEEQKEAEKSNSNTPSKATESPTDDFNEYVNEFDREIEKSYIEGNLPTEEYEYVDEGVSDWESIEEGDE